MNAPARFDNIATADVDLTAIMEREHIVKIKRVPAGYTVTLEGDFYGIGASVGAAYDMARNARIDATWRALA